ncbi:MAG: hypothetical protein ACOVQ4_09795 [Flectobacillus sp.]|uniref:hypothetical protein n=1 Tax=Flectobacillus sp. TaxID=50419 RepID=UPI003B9D901C
MLKFYPILFRKISDVFRKIGVTHLIVLLLGQLAASCSSDDIVKSPSQIPDSKDYLMTEIGQFVTFSVKELHYSLNQEVDIETYFEKHLLLEIHNSKKSFVIGIFRKKQENEAWLDIGRKLLALQDNKIIVSTSNQTECILVNPIEVGTQWNLNLFNQKTPQKAEIISFFGDWKVQNKPFKNIIEVDLYKDSSALGLQKKQILLAPNLGIVFSKESNVSYCYEDNCLGKGQINYGTIITYELIDYGKE